MEWMAGRISAVVLAENLELLLFTPYES